MLALVTQGEVQRLAFGGDNLESDVFERARLLG
jgi:hypothetical protein